MEVLDEFGPLLGGVILVLACCAPGWRQRIQSRRRRRSQTAQTSLNSPPRRPRPLNPADFETTNADALEPVYADAVRDEVHLSFSVCQPARPAIAASSAREPCLPARAVSERFEPSGLVTVSTPPPVPAGVRRAAQPVSITVNEFATPAARSAMLRPAERGSAQRRAERSETQRATERNATQRSAERSAAPRRVIASGSRERAVAQLIRERLTSLQISERLGIPLGEVEFLARLARLRAGKAD